MPERSDFEVVREALKSWHFKTPTHQRRDAQDARAALTRLFERMEKLERVAEAARRSVERFPSDVDFGGTRGDLREALAALADDAEEEK